MRGKLHRPGFRNLTTKYVSRLLGVMAIIFCATASADDLKPSGTVEISQVQIAFIGSGNLGGGTLRYDGKSYPFTVGGLGIGGIGISKMEAVGTIYDMKRLADFPGAYVQGRYGYAVGEAGNGELWLKNANGVILKLRTKRQGLALSLGGDAVYINLD